MLGREKNFVHKRGAGTKPMVKMKSYIAQNKKTGAKCLIVYYDQDNFNQAIEKGLSDHGLEPGKIQVIALPKSMCKQKAHCDAL